MGKLIMIGIIGVMGYLIISGTISVNWQGVGEGIGNVLGYIISGGIELVRGIGGAVSKSIG